MLLKVLSPYANAVATGQALRLFGKHRSLILAMTRRELVDRYALAERARGFLIAKDLDPESDNGSGPVPAEGGGA